MSALWPLQSRLPCAEWCHIARSLGAEEAVSGSGLGDAASVFPLQLITSVLGQVYQLCHSTTGLLCPAL